jgi:curved DNA-binding protein CbpA
MSGYGKNGRTTAGKVVMDWYKILQISPSSTSNEIKAAYYKIAQTAHPDKHNGCSKKLEQFKRINEAYDILSNPTKRNEYDVQMGHHHRHHSGRAAQPRRHNIPKDYRKVYTSRPPPEWKMVWDHTKHYEMHYGDGFQKEAMKQAIKTAEQDGSFIYHSSLGKGFTFHHLHDRSTTASSTTMNGTTNDANRHHGATTNSSNYNPYSKNQAQGPQKIILDYQEITQNYGGDGSSTSSRSKRQGILKHERIVYDLHLRRYERYRDEVWNESQQDQPQRQSTTTAQHHNGGAAANDSQTSTTATTRTRSPIYSRFDWKYQQEQQQRQHQESLLSSFNFFSSFLTTAPINLNGHDNNNNYNSTNSTPSDSNGTPNEHDTSEDRPTTNPHNKQQQQHNGMTESTAKNSSCTIM